MPTGLAFTGSSNPLTFPDLPPLQGGVGVQLWLRRSADGGPGAILHLGAADGSLIALESGPTPGALIFSHTRGATRQEISVAGALPLGRFVQITATLGQDGRARVLLFGAKVAEGNLGAPGGAARSGCALAPLSPRGRLYGAVANLKIYCPRTSSYGPDGGLSLQAADLFADYPLDGATLHHHEVVRGREIAYYAARDQSGNNRLALTLGEPPLYQEDGPLLDDPIPALALAEERKTPIALSGLSAMGSGELTIEAFVNPLVRPGNRSYSLLSLDAGLPGVLSLSVGSGGVLLWLERAQADVGNPIIAKSETAIPLGRFTHVAVTLRRSGDDVAVQLFHNGQLRAQRTVLSGTYVGLCRALRAILGRKNFNTVHLAGFGSGYFAGALSEVRVWSRALSAEDLAARWLLRAAGDEPGLRACYRLDETISGCVTDISASRGFGLLPGGASISAAAGLPLPSPLATRGPRLVARGKLTRESVPVKRILASRTGRTVRYEEEQVLVFDATLRPTASGGQSISGVPIEVRLDQPLTAVITSQGETSYVPWSSGQGYTVPVPASGTVRLRFLAKELGCPTLRVRMQGMNDGQWLPVRPDGPVLAGLRAVTTQGLQRPADGRPSPLPPGTSDADADALATAIAGVGRALPPQPPAGSQSRSLLGDIGDGVTSGYRWVSRQVSEGGEALAGVVALSEDAARTARRLPKTASQLLLQGGDALTDLYKKARSTAARQGPDAARAFLSTADTVAVVTSAAVDEIDSVIEIVGSSLVGGATAYWRVIVSGVNDALAAISALAQRVGAEIQKILDYLAYLFRWDDFLKASDEAVDFCEKALAGLPGFLRGLSGYKAKVGEALRSAVPQSVANKTMAELFGVDINRDAAGVDEINYVVDLIEQVYSYGELAMTAATSGSVGALKPAALSAEAERTRRTLPLSTLRDPVALLTTPMGALLAGGSSSAASSTSLVDALFDSINRSLEEGVRATSDFLHKRIDVPWLTGFVEKTLLKGRELTFLRLVGLVAAIAKVLAHKLGGGAVGAGRSSASVRALSGDGAQPRASTDSTSSANSPSGWDLWVQMSFGLLGTTLTLIQTGLELAFGTKRSESAERILAGLTLGIGGFVGTRALIMSAYTGVKGTGPIKPYATASYALEGVAGFWLLMSGKSRLEGEDPKVQDLCDVGVFGVLTLALLGLSITPLASGMVSGTQAVVSFGLRSASFVLSSGLRVLSAADNEDGKYKRATLVLGAVCGGVDLSEAIYDYTYDIRAGTR